VRYDSLEHKIKELGQVMRMYCTSPIEVTLGANDFDGLIAHFAYKYRVPMPTTSISTDEPLTIHGVTVRRKL
jgi:hypothetical protein